MSLATRSTNTVRSAAVSSAAFVRPAVGVSLRRGAVSPAVSRPLRQVVRPLAYSEKPEPTPAAADKKSIKVPTPKLNVDIKQLMTWNFLVQLGLTAISWAVVFFTSHAGMASGHGMHATTGVVLLGVALAGYSTYLSYGYVMKVKKDGLDVLQGWEQLKQFYDHMTINFVGAGATLLALQAEVGSLMMKSMTTKAAASTLSVEALAQAATNTLLAHVVSLIMLTLMVRKITEAYKNLLDWSESLRKSIPTFGN